MSVIAFTKVALPYGWLGNMAPYPIEWDGKTWRTTEALFQARRLSAEDPGREEIRAEKSPMGAKMASKRSADRRVIKPLSKEDIELMEDVLRLKLAQHPELAEWLRETGTIPIIEDCTARPRGSGLFWGAAKREDGSWKGGNMLGRLWMKLRTELNTIRVVIREEELNGWSTTGKVFRAYRVYGDGLETPLYLGEETRDALEQRVKDNHPTAIILPPE